MLKQGTEEQNHTSENGGITKITILLDGENPLGSTDAIRPTHFQFTVLSAAIPLVPEIRLDQQAYRATSSVVFDLAVFLRAIPSPPESGVDKYQSRNCYCSI